MYMVIFTYNMTRENVLQISKINIVQTVTIAISIVGAVTALLNLWLVANLSSVKQDIAVIAREVKANEDMDLREHPNFVLQNEFKQHTAQMNRIEDKLDNVLSGRSGQLK